MTIAKWSAYGTRSSNLSGTTLNSLVNGSESTTITYDNSTDRNLYASITLKLGSITPATGGSITLRVTINDGTDTSDRIGGDLYTIPLTSGASSKVNIIPMVRLYPASLRFSIINNAGVTLNASGNELYVRPFNEDIA